MITYNCDTGFPSLFSNYVNKTSFNTLNTWVFILTETTNKNQLNDDTRYKNKIYNEYKTDEVDRIISVIEPGHSKIIRL